MTFHRRWPVPSPQSIAYNGAPELSVRPLYWTVITPDAEAVQLKFSGIAK